MSDTVSVSSQNNLSSTDCQGIIDYNRKNLSYLNESNFSNYSTNLQKSVHLERNIYQLKIILVGDSGVGKTSLMNRFMGYSFIENCPCTINVDYRVKNLNINPLTSAELTIWDTCGQEKYRSLTKQYFKDAHGVILVYSINDYKSYLEAQIWLKEIKNNCNDNTCIILVGNKIDLIDRKVSKEDANNFATENNLLYVETSAKDGMYIDLPFENLAMEIIKNVNMGKNENNKYIEQSLKKDIDKKIFERKREKEFSCC